MAITSVGTVGQVSHATSTSSWVTAFSGTGPGINEWVIAIVSTDNINTTDGNHNEHVSITGDLTFTKIGEYTNGEGLAADGATVSAWVAQNTTGSAIGTLDVTITFSGAIVEKCATAWKFSASSSLAIVPGTLQQTVLDASTGFGSMTISGLPSAERLYVRAMTKEANTTAALTTSTGFTSFTVIRSQPAASAVISRGEWRINTSTGETSDPSSISGDSASLFFALSEGEPASGNQPIVIICDD